MEKSKSIKKLMNVGLILIPIMLLILFLSSTYIGARNTIFEDGGAFFVNYIISVVYTLFVIFSNKPFYKLSRIDKRLVIISLTLFSISSFTLNYDIVIFAQFTLWVKIYLYLFYSSLIGLCFIHKFNSYLKYAIYFFLGAGLVLTSYFALYLMPIYHISIIGLIFFGLTIHLLIPLILTIILIFILYRLKKTKTEKAFLFSGITLPIIVIVAFLFQWNTIQKEIHKSTSSIITRPNNTLPEWVLLCQDMPSDKFSQKIIKGSMVYDTFSNLWDGGLGSTNFDEIKRHDPLVNIGIGLLGKINIDRNTRVKILKSQYNARHHAQRKLWTGRDLSITDVLNNVKIMPEYRLAYSEKIITIKNSNKRDWNEQEAAFTFYLPEGSVATSLSLWIDGKEEKSRLTTKEKADSAYRTIVGVERRDPALLHWQEGNTLTVTVFPCTPKENRKFKIGITTPLEKDGNILRLKNVYFDGPVSNNIRETSKITLETSSEIKNIKVPDGFDKEIDGSYLYQGGFRPYWEIECNNVKLSSKSFYFNNHSYSVKESDNETYEFNPKKVYLDINKSWTKEEFENIINLLSEKDVYIYYDNLIQVNDNNKTEVFNILGKKNFSLFPFNEINDWKNSLVISKSTELSPNLADLEKTDFLDNLINNINNTEEKINIFQLGHTTSPYLKSLNEFQITNLHTGDITELNKIIRNKFFYQYNSNPNEVNIGISDIIIIKDSSKVNSNAPDHLFRLYAYNSLMKSMGKNYFNKNKDYINTLVDIANEAYIVSPVSSLIVLETIKDYDRFNINENENSLKNASMKSSGAVPEPGEWVLIGLFALILSFVLYKKKAIRIKRWE